MTVHRQIFVKQRNLVSNMICKAKKDYLCHKDVNCGCSRELFYLCGQMIGKFRDTLLPSNISPKYRPDKFNEFFVRKTEEIRSSSTLTDQSPQTLLSSLTQSLKSFNLQLKRPTSLVALIPHTISCPVWMKLFPL